MLWSNWETLVEMVGKGELTEEEAELIAKALNEN